MAEPGEAEVAFFSRRRQLGLGVGLSEGGELVRAIEGAGRQPVMRSSPAQRRRQVDALPDPRRPEPAGALHQCRPHPAGQIRDPAPAAAYQASRIAAERRADHLARKASFATETVFSHASKLELVREAKARGFIVILYHVGGDRGPLGGAVEDRIEEGGHAVPEAKVRERYARCGALIREAMRLCHQGYVFDNSRLNTPPERIIGFTAGG